MSTQTDAMKLALEQTLEMLSDNREYIEANERADYLAMYDKAIAGAEKALAEQPAQQEPFGYFKAEPFGWTDCAETDEGAIALYVTPQAQPAREPLTDDELADLWYKQSLDWMEFARAIEAKLREKNQ